MSALRNKAILCETRIKGRLQTRGWMTTQVHKKMVKRHVMIRLSVPRPSDSSTHPTVVSEGAGAWSSADGAEEAIRKSPSSIHNYVRARLIRKNEGELDKERCGNGLNLNSR